MKRLVLIGYPVGHSLSPAMQNAALKAAGLEKDFRYEKMPVKPEELEGFVGMVRSGKISGANVTIPHKIGIIKYLDGLSSEAELIGAVNTLYLKAGKVIGHNTDGYGCLESLKERGVDVGDKKIVILGAGGAARAVAFVLGMNGARQLAILNRSEEKAVRLAEDVKAGTGTAANSGGLDDTGQELKDAEVLINCTSVGMKGPEQGGKLVTAGMLRPGMVVMDAVYNPLKTQLLEEAGKAGCKTVDGVGMLVHQGAAGFELWTGRKAPLDVMREAVVKELQ
jgi:shikimate dehydrogenase